MLIPTSMDIQCNRVYDNATFESPKQEDEALISVTLNDSAIAGGEFNNSLWTDVCFNKTVVGASFTGVHFEAPTSKNNTRFVDCDLLEVSMNEGRLFDTVFSGVTFDDRNIMSNCVFTRVVFSKCSFKDIRFDDCEFNSCRFEDCTFSGRKDETRENKSGVDFNKCGLTQTGFTRCDFQARRLPNGMTSLLVGNESTHLNKCNMTSVVFTNCTTSGLNRDGLARAAFVNGFAQTSGYAPVDPTESKKETPMGRDTAKDSRLLDYDDDDMHAYLGMGGGVSPANAGHRWGGLGSYASWSSGMSQNYTTKTPEVKKNYPYRFFTGGIE